MMEKRPHGEVCTCAITIVRHADSPCRDSRDENVASAKPKRMCYQKQPEERDILLKQALMIVGA
jgi:hypothetical protein